MSLLGIQVAHPHPEFKQAVGAEAGQPDLHRAWVVEAGIAGEIGGQSLRQRGKPLHPGRPVEERRSAGNHQYQAGESPRVHLIDELPQRVQRLVAHIAAHPLQRLHLVEDHYQPGVARIAQHHQQSLEESQRAEVVQGAFDARLALHPGTHVGLSSQPREQSLRCGGVTRALGPLVATQRGGETGRAARHLRQAKLEQLGHRRRQVLRVGAGRQRVLLQREQPTVDHPCQRRGGQGVGGEVLDDAPVDGFQFVQRRLGLADLHLCGGKTCAAGAFLQPAGEERFACAVFAADRFEHRTTTTGDLQVFVDGGLETSQSHRQKVKAVGGHSAAPQCVDHLALPPRAHPCGTHRPPGPVVPRLPSATSATPNCSRSSGSSSTTVTPSGSTEIAW